jgi:hypothetical protein
MLVPAFYMARQEPQSIPALFPSPLGGPQAPIASSLPQSSYDGQGCHPWGALKGAESGKRVGQGKEKLGGEIRSPGSTEAYKSPGGCEGF